MLYVGAATLRVEHWALRWGRVQWAITVGLAPLLLVLFQQVSVVSPVANAIAIPGSELRRDAARAHRGRGAGTAR